MVDWAVLVCPFLLPLSFLWDMLAFWRLRISYWLQGTRALLLHRDKVAKVQDQVRRWRQEGEGRRMCTARPSWMSISQQKLGYKEHMYRVDLGGLGDVLRIDTEAMEVTVEPYVTIGFLNRVLVPEGVTLAVVPELDALTIGGLLMGGGIESTSHKHGLFHRLATEVELVTAEGETLTVSEEHHADIFHALPMSYGTLGFVVSAKLRLVRYLPFLRLEYRPTRSLEDSARLLEQEARGEGDSVEGIAFSRDTAVIMTGTFVEEADVEWDKVNSLGRWYKPWFYQHVETFLTSGPAVEYVPTLHFHQRHNKPTFWLTSLWLPWASGPLARLLTGWILPMNHHLLCLVKETFLQGELADNWVLQDFILPIHHLKEGIQLSHDSTAIYPLWMVPVTLEGEVDKSRGSTLFVDLGVYGVTELNEFNGRDATLRKFEKFTLEKGGFQALYAETLLEEEDFDRMFVEGQHYYKKARASLPLCSEAFPEVYQKVSRVGRARVRAGKAKVA